MSRVATVALSLAVLSLLLGIPSPAAANPEPSVSVLVDFGDGTYLWADVMLPLSNVTALKATDLANETWGLPPLEVTWFDSPFCLRSPCAFVDDIGDRNPVYPLWWHFYMWNATTDTWELGLGPSDTDLADGDAIAWYLAVDDPNTFASPRPVPAPSFRDVQTSFRGDLQNRGVAHGAIPVTNTVLWDVDIGVLEIDATPTVAYGMVYVATRNALVALDAATGQEGWRNPQVRSLLSTPAVYDGHLVLGGIDGRLHYVNAFNGTEEWSVLLEPGARSTGIASSPAIREGRAYVGTFNETAGGLGRVAAVNLNNGTIAWTYETASIHMSQPAIADGNLYVGVMGVYDGDIGYDPPFGLLALGLDGTLNWFFETGGSVASSPVFADGRIYVTAKDGNLYAVNGDGSLAWQRAIGVSTSSPALGGDLLFLAAGGFRGVGAMYAFTLEGGIVWSQDTKGAVQASLVTDGRLVCGATNRGDGRHFCLRASDGLLAWEFVPNPIQFILGSATVVGNTMYLPSDNGHIYAIRDASPAAAPLLDFRLLPSPGPPEALRTTGFCVSTLGRGLAVNVTLNIVLPAGLQLSDESVQDPSVPRLRAVGLGDWPPDRAGVECIAYGIQSASGPPPLTVEATLTYEDLAGRTYPPISRTWTLSLPPPTDYRPIVLVAVAAGAAALAIPFILWRRARRGKGDA